MPFEILKPDTVDQSYDRTNITIFIAGSIDNGNASMWSRDVQQAMKDYDDVTMFNPRREVWMPEIEQRARNDVFRYQVNWELDHIETADIVFFYFEPGSVSPITLQELGFVIGRLEADPVVCCPDRFWRKGNVEIMCQRASVPLYHTLDDAIIALKGRVELYRKES